MGMQNCFPSPGFFLLTPNAPARATTYRLWPEGLPRDRIKGLMGQGLAPAVRGLATYWLHASCP